MTSAPKTNKEWHAGHKMPLKANLDQRIQWHIDHKANCGCRPIPAKVAIEMKKRRMVQ